MDDEFEKADARVWYHIQQSTLRELNDTKKLLKDLWLELCQEKNPWDLIKHNTELTNRLSSFLKENMTIELFRPIIEQIISIIYKNYKGEIKIRSIQPVEIFFGSTEYHLEQQWFLKAFDLDKHAMRDFAIKDILQWKNVK